MNSMNSEKILLFSMAVAILGGGLAGYFWGEQMTSADRIENAHRPADRGKHH